VGAPHNKSRYGELWDQARIDVCLEEVDAIRDVVTLSGGWAWHFMSPVGHAELKHAHDHKDIDVFVHPLAVPEAIALFEEREFQRVWTRYDRLPSAEEFRRYEKTVEIDGQKPVKVTVDFFVNVVPSIVVRGYRVVEPATLLTFYGSIHSSDKCFAVQAATRLLARGIDPVGHFELVAIPRG
jgi:hypothetical protein